MENHTRERVRAICCIAVSFDRKLIIFSLTWELRCQERKCATNTCPCSQFRSAPGFVRRGPRLAAFIHRTGHNRVQLRPQRPDGCWVEVRSAEAVAQPNGGSYTGASMTVPSYRILGGSAFIPMVETAELRDGEDFASGGWQYWTGLGQSLSSER
jgi:hypothetical protein